jgi:trk system potassium uptake protein TrkH
MIAAGFAAVILLGTMLMTLPAAGRDGVALPFGDALFTAASAACVTGLVVYDTYTRFSLFGQLVILCLVQIGGLGFMTVGSLFLMMARKRIGLAERGALTESVSAFQIGGIVRLVRRVIRLTAILEGAGAALLAVRFCPRLGVAEGLYFALFHSVSAFCNAGFDLMGRFAPYASLIPYQRDVLVNLTIMSLTVMGGLGFVVWDDLLERRPRFAAYRLHTKLVLVSTAALVAVGAALFGIFERGNTLAGMGFADALLTSLFQSVSLRTAGFATVDMGSLSEGGTVLCMLLMMVGASPGSAGGGVKTTTVMVILLATFSYVRGDGDVSVFGRRLEGSVVRRAYCVATIYAALTVVGVFLLLAAQGLSVRDAALEALSAISTAGLATGVTRGLNTLSRAIIVLLMYCGRVGSLTLVMAVMTDRKPRMRNPEEKIIIG